MERHQGRLHHRGQEEQDGCAPDDGRRKPSDRRQHAVDGPRPGPKAQQPKRTCEKSTSAKKEPPRVPRRSLRLRPPADVPDQIGQHPAHRRPRRGEHDEVIGRRQAAARST
jgi:hypothetical protein